MDTTAAATAKAVDSTGRSNPSTTAANGSSTESSVYSKDSETKKLVAAETNAESPSATRSTYRCYKESGETRATRWFAVGSATAIANDRTTNCSNTWTKTGTSGGSTTSSDAD